MSKRNCLPLNVDKCLVMHYNGRLRPNPCNNYMINGVLLSINFINNICADRVIIMYKYHENFKDVLLIIIIIY